MLDNQLIQLIISIINNGRVVAGIPNVTIKSAYQPTRQGINTEPTAYLFKVGDHRLGSPYSNDQWGETAQSSFTGEISGNILTITAVVSGTLTLNQTLSGANIVDGTLWIAGFGTGMGGTGTYLLNQSLSTPLTSQAIIGIAGMANQNIQQYETTFQIMALATQNPSTPNAYTASDIINAIAYILQNESTIGILEAQGIGILRVQDVRNAPFIDDRDRFEFGPNFDFVITHKRGTIQTIPILQEEELRVISV